MDLRDAAGGLPTAMNYGIGNNVTILIPGIECRKFCADGVGPTGAIGFTGYVTNTGNTPLSNVGVTNSVNGVLGIITNNITLPVGGAVNFTGSYQGVRGPNMNVIFVGGIDALGSNVTSQCEATCTTVLESRADTSNFSFLLPRGQIGLTQLSLHLRSRLGNGNHSLTFRATARW